MHGPLTVSRGLRFAMLGLLFGGCASLPDNGAQYVSYALQDTATTALGQKSQAVLQGFPGDNGFLPLKSGVDALLARIVLADAAQRSLDVQYYIWHDDLTGRIFAHALLRAADRGVRIRVLLDDVGARANDETLLAIEAHPNIEVRLFNPLASRSLRGLGMLTDFSRVNRRMHNKAFVADNQAAILGGRNIGDEYFDASSDVAFDDLDVLTLGPVVDAVSRSFDQYWNAPSSYPVASLLGRSADSTSLARLRADLAAFIEANRDSPYVTQTGKRFVEAWTSGHPNFFRGAATLLYDDPAKIGRAPDVTEGHLLPQFSGISAQIQQELLIVSPYFIPGKAGVAWLNGLVKRGIRVTVLTNSLAATDVGAVHSGYQRYREALLEGGVAIYELKPGAVQPAHAEKKAKAFGASRASLHAKSFVFDRRAVFIGSLNLDPRSIQLNTEIGVVCESPPLAEEIAGTIERNFDSIAWRLERVVDASGHAHIEWVEAGAAGERRYLGEPEVGAMRRFSVWLLGLLPIESQL
ncbi:phospholipase D family protein [Thiobacillus sp.]|uniref:phospholipase D family protein n=1 Tax=Thiobacillus sp. TaxID=924 RepID=UPI00286E25EF|nr:phospholipase D family protein [Thiobacillus sp.]